MDINTLVRWVTIFLCILILTIGSCCIHQDYQRGKAVEHGVSPTDARLMFHDTSMYSDIALIIEASKRKD